MYDNEYCLIVGEYNDSERFVCLSKQHEYLSMMGSHQIVNTTISKISLSTLSTILNSCDTVKLLEFMNSCQKGKTVDDFFSTVNLCNLSTLHLCNLHLDEKYLAHFGFLQYFPIQTLCLDNNNLGDSGFLILLSILQQLPHITSLSLENTDIGDVAVENLCYYIDYHSTMKAVNIQHNNYSQKRTFDRIRACNSHCKIEYDSIVCPIIRHVDYLKNKTVKDLCIFLQLLSIQLGENAPVVQMPDDLRFNLSFENHRNLTLLELMNRKNYIKVVKPAKFACESNGVSGRFTGRRV